MPVTVVGEREIEYPRVEVDGIEGYYLRNVHYDVTGNWGGHRAMVAHFNMEGGDGDASGLMYLYALVGPYWQVGKWDETNEPSTWEIVAACLEALEKGADKVALHAALLGAIPQGEED